jgi:shikimate 5-dehydrogenase
MKIFLRNFLILLTVAGCVNLTPAQQNALSTVESTGLAAGLGYLSGGAGGAAIAAAPGTVSLLQQATLALRSTENPSSTAIPTPAQISSAITAVVQTPSVAKSIGPQIATAIVNATATGVPPAKAIESAAVGLDQAAAVATVSSSGS